MHYAFKSCISSATLAAMFWFMPTAIAQTPEKSGTPVQFDSADKVELRGTFYASAKPKAPCVILLHNIGGNRHQKGWDELAKVLSKDFAVLSFDFRGHGESTNVDPAIFWKSPGNSMIRGAQKMPSKISYKDFPDGYFPMLVNDIAAAKRYLDQQNDANTCNTSNIVVIGAQEGASLGALWIASEWQKPKYVRTALGDFVPDRRSTSTDGENIVAAVWLSMPRRSKYLGNRDVQAWVVGTGHKVRDNVPMVFVYGKGDNGAATAATTLLADMKKAGKDKLELTATREKEGKFAGVDLLDKKSLNTEEDITAYLNQHVLARGARAWAPKKPDEGPPLVLVPLQSFGFTIR
jgi:pimeloyl-ACP methyl ester carboxylesterase